MQKYKTFDQFEVTCKGTHQVGVVHLCHVGWCAAPITRGTAVHALIPCENMSSTTVDIHASEESKRDVEFMLTQRFSIKGV